MCFSPGASFAGGVIISAIGVVTVSKVHKPSQVLFASIPLFFAFQQFAEGFIWSTLLTGDNVAIQKISTYIFLITAQVIWPVMIPLSVFLMEKSKKKKDIIFYLLLIGLLLSVYYAFCLVIFNVNPCIDGYHIKYQHDFPKRLSMPAFMLYLAATITPLFVSSVKKTHLLGVLMTLSMLVTAIFFTQYLTSVWCFFAALISGVIYWILNDSKKQFILADCRHLNPKAESL